MATVHNGEPMTRERGAEWTERRIAYLTTKKKQLKDDYETRTANVEEELSQRKAELKAYKAPKKSKK